MIHYLFFVERPTCWKNSNVLFWIEELGLNFLSSVDQRDPGDFGDSSVESTAPSSF